ncbi:hypothetical protein BH10PSE7_BH10PSE7_35800 [soil metagenome]
MRERFYTLSANDISVTLDLAAGHVRSFAIVANGKIINPLYTAPWVDDAATYGDESIPLNLRCLSGDFFCAPFAASDLDGAPLHGWPANSSWRFIGSEPHPQGGVVGRFELEKRVLGARLIKEFTLRDHHPFLYERHIFIGGSGAVPVANHAMTKFSKGGRLFFSPKSFGETLKIPLEPDPARGRSYLRHATRFTDLAKIETQDIAVADLSRYPLSSNHEDFVMLVEAAGSELGWAAALRPAEGDMLISLKNPKTYPVTFLWFSNGGRYYPPWNGKHVGVLGIEEGRSFSAYGHKASITRNELSDAGLPTALELDPQGETEVRNVIGGLPLAGWTELVTVESGGDKLILVGPGGQTRTVPYDGAFLATSDLTRS